MYLYNGNTSAERIKLCIRWFLLLCLLAGDTNLRKKILWEEFEWAFMRKLPISMADFDKVQDFDVVFQHMNTYDQETNYPDKYMVGVYQPTGSRYERVHLLSRVNPFLEYKLVKAVSDLYQTDSTYLDVLARNRKNQLEAIVYRKVKPDKISDEDIEYMMWKKEKILIQPNGFKTRLIEKWNRQLFN